MVLRCAWGTCNGDERYPERLEGAYLVRFPTSKRDFEKCKRWIKACGRPHHQLNILKINQHKAVCSKHFVGDKGPTKEFPDPVAADGSLCRPVRKPPVKRVWSETSLGQAEEVISRKTKRDLPLKENTLEVNLLGYAKSNAELPSVATQTEELWTSALDTFSLVAENADLKDRLVQQTQEIGKLKRQLTSKNKTINDLRMKLLNSKSFCIDIVKTKEVKLKNLVQYYTGITYLRFLALLTFLVPEGSEVDYSSGRKDIKGLQKKDGLFLTLCRLRHAFGLKDIATRFGLSTQSASIVFNTWLDMMYFKLGQLSIWPHRDDIIKNMPADFRKDFPTTLIIIDGTEIRTQTPSALSLQSQLYSDYKSSNTLKALIGCDPNGCLMFVSELYTGGISDKAITEQSGFYEVIKSLKNIGFINEGDAIMVDKGFSIDKEMCDLGLKINIPPFAQTNKQLSVSETALTQKIAKHRVHVERLICKVKTFKLVSHCVPTSLFSKINRIWSVVCHLTLFQDVFVKDK